MNSGKRVPGQPEVRSLVRGLELLQALNRRRRATAVELAADTGLARATCYRLLETLAAQGYLSHDLSSGTFVLEYRVRTLADGFGDEEWLTQVAAPQLRALHRKLVWPIALATPAGDAMYVRLTTSLISPLALDRVPVGFRVPILTSAVGMACFAYLPATTRRTIRDMLVSLEGPDAQFARNQTLLRSLVAQTRKRGYATRVRGFNHRTSSLAVPILRQGRALASLNVSWHHAAMPLAEAVRRFLDPLRAGADQIELALASRL